VPISGLIAQSRQAVHDLREAIKHLVKSLWNACPCFDLQSPSGLVVEPPEIAGGVWCFAPLN
jgi:hypothetical protein